ncbi:hypothetical protein CYLTODRAFT_427552 [Cylindrobasidium torrendii FP15055 ss-10]|uniref:Uncharacterized protein n=1 Tax=Cylindrobasidium torrendii FP15055 ss-10 TaxID=1314674 RepID=A0A0D7AT75_9AGAR|nr:hypothetical protein CYLTODRAFT_427552 [Cylindrobasidium torrendii FP15055 ss-10]
MEGSVEAHNGQGHPLRLRQTRDLASGQPTLGADQHLAMHRTRSWVRPELLSIGEHGSLDVRPVVGKDYGSRPVASRRRIWLAAPVTRSYLAIPEREYELARYENSASQLPRDPEETSHGHAPVPLKYSIHLRRLTHPTNRASQRNQTSCPCFSMRTRRWATTRTLPSRGIAVSLLMKGTCIHEDVLPGFGDVLDLLCAEVL